MSLTFSRMFPLGETAPDFSLLEPLSGKTVSLDDVKSSDKGTIVMFICNHCPYVKHIKTTLAAFTKEYQEKGFSFVAISSNDAEAFPNDGPDAMKADAKEFDYTFPYLFDETQLVAKAYMAACTPDFYVFNPELKCVYRGRFDESNHKNGIPSSGKDLREVLDIILKGEQVSTDQQPSAGCNIKWKSGVSPF